MDESRIISEDEARKILEPHFGRLRACYRWAWKQWEDKPPEERLLYSARSRASFIHDCATSRARIEFDGVPGVKIVEDHGFLVLVFEDVVVLRFKKFKDGSLGTSGIATQQQQRFSFQDPLPGVPVANYVVAGYLLNKLETAVSTMAVTCSVGPNLRWFIDISEDDAASGDFVRPVQPDAPSAPRIRPAFGEERDAEDSSAE